MKKGTELIIYQNDFRDCIDDAIEDNAVFEEETAQIRKAVNETYREEIDHRDLVFRLLLLSSSFANRLHGWISCSLTDSGLILKTEIVTKEWRLEDDALGVFRALCESMESLTIETVSGNAVMVATYGI